MKFIRVLFEVINSEISKYFRFKAEVITENDGK